MCLIIISRLILYESPLSRLFLFLPFLNHPLFFHWGHGRTLGRGSSGMLTLGRADCRSSSSGEECQYRTSGCYQDCAQIRVQVNMSNLQFPSAVTASGGPGTCGCF